MGGGDTQAISSCRWGRLLFVSRSPSSPPLPRGPCLARTTAPRDRRQRQPAQYVVASRSNGAEGKKKRTRSRKSHVTYVWARNKKKRKKEGIGGRDKTTTKERSSRSRVESVPTLTKTDYIATPLSTFTARTEFRCPSMLAWLPGSWRVTEMDTSPGGGGIR